MPEGSFRPVANASPAAATQLANAVSTAASTAVSTAAYPPNGRP
jgi:hypothetical protein